MKHALRVLLGFTGLLILIGLICPPLHAREEILSYHSDIQVHENGSMTVAETIRVQVEGDQIKRGIYRDFPTRYEGPNGTNYRVEFELVEVRRNGQPEPYHIENRSNGVRVYVGEKNTFIDHEIHTYKLVYLTDRQLGFFETHDELYWNVTGSDWAFPIRRASATVHLPGSLFPSQIEGEAYTGAYGSPGRDYRVARKETGLIRLETTRPLGPREGFTIVVTWPKGYVDEPTYTQSIGYFLRDNLGMLLGLIGLIITALYYYFCWRKAGRDPEGKTIIPRFEPSRDLSPADHRYLANMGYDDKTLSAALINMAVKGFLEIEHNDGWLSDSYTLKKTGRSEDQLTNDEKILADELLGSRDELELEQENHEIIGDAIDEFKDQMEEDFKKTHFVKNTWYFVGGLVLSGLSLIAMMFFILKGNSGDAGDAVASVLFLTVFGGIFSLVLYNTFMKVWRTRRWFRLVIIILFLAPFVLVLGAILMSFASGLTVLLLEPTFWIICGFIALNVIFLHLLKAPTVEGREVLDEIRGFKQYLSVAEQERLNMMNDEPKQTPELFEKYLPYALALGVENEWAEYFSTVLERATQAQGRSGYHPHWYHGDFDTPTSLTSNLGSSFSSNISSSSTPPGSSSGSGGGGFSGGGGGGGGGGGW